MDPSRAAEDTRIHTMAEPNLAAPDEPLNWLPYQRAIVGHLKQVDPHVWNWFSKAAHDPSALAEVRFDLLKSTYRVDRESQPTFYEVADRVSRSLGIDAPITIYQAHDPAGLNASLAYVPDEIHLILHGPIAEKLSPVEIQALFGHELAHFLLWRSEGGELLVATEVLRALTNDVRAHTAHVSSRRLLRLYDEIFCDRASYTATNDLNAVISMLVKVHTGVQDVNPESYLKQADEIFTQGPASTAGITHPEPFIRARAIRLYVQQSPDVNEQIAAMIEGKPGIDDLDLLAQQQVSMVTRRLLDALLCRKWFQTDLVLAHARLYFDDYAPPPAELTDDNLSRDVQTEPDSLRDYYCFVLLDFASADRDLEEAPLAAAVIMAEKLGMKARFAELARQELRLRKNQLDKIDQQKETIIADANRMAATLT
jgi:hypothetical protein